MARFSLRWLLLFFPAEKPFKQAAKTLVGVLLAFFGGLAAQWFYATRDRTQEIARSTAAANVFEGPTNKEIDR